MATKLRLSERKTKQKFVFVCFSNRWSSESHRASTFGRVAKEENVVNESKFADLFAELQKVDSNTK